MSDQLKQAVDYYLQVRKDNPNANITFTGHSLGGGIAALMGVFFGEQAVTFDQAPFANTAEQGLLGTASGALDLQIYLLGKTYTDPAMVAVRDTAVSDLSSFLQVQQNIGGIPNSDLVSTFRVTGEFTSSFPVGTLFDQIGAPATFIQHGPTNISAFTELHAQSLLAAFLQSQQTAATGNALNDVTFKLTDLLGMIFDGNLFAHPTNDPKFENFLEHLVRHEAGVLDPATGATTIAPDAMVTRFTSDMWKLAQDGGLTMSDGNSLTFWNSVSKTLIAFAMQMYYEDTANATNANKQLFTDLSTAGAGSNGIQFDMADVSKTFAATITANEKLNLADAKGYQYFQTYIETTGLLAPEERTLIKSLLPYMRDWYVQAGASGMNATDTLNRGAFMLGGAGSDAMVGGTGADLLIGNAGADTLQGGQGNDTLLGGVGNDIYKYNAGDGLDTILDTGGQNDLAVDGTVLAGGDQYGDNRVHKDANGHLYVDAGQGNLIVDGNILIQNYGTGGTFGLNLSATPMADPATTGLTLTGDFAPIDQDAGTPGMQTQTDSLGNLITDPNTPEPGRADWLYGDTGNDVLIGKGGGDILYGSSGDDRLYADTQISVATAIAQGNILNSGTGLRSDWLAGGEGSDTLVGSTSNDVLSGGGGADLLIAGAGNDDILGDTSYLASSFDWTVTDSNGTWIFSPVIELPAAGAADVIYAGEGNDYVWAGAGNDVVFGEGGDDRLNGNEGNDTILGGTGADTLWGGADSDYLDGGDAVDEIVGGAGDDILIGGAGNDTLYGQEGKDTYIFNRGDGHDTLYDTSDNTQSNANILRFGAGISANDITLRLGSLILDLGNGDEVHIGDFDQNDVFNSSSITGFEFADGTILTTTELLARGFDLDGTAGDDQIDGTNTTDRINGLAGNDTLSGMDGNDMLNGGAGADTLYGGTGDDTYAVDNVGDVVTEDLNAGTDTVQSSVSFALGANVENLTLTGPSTGSGQAAASIDGTGNELDNAITGNAANNALDGGTGNDTLGATQGGSDILDGGAGGIGERQRICAAIINSGKAANDGTTHAWRVAA